jgi:Right handed beta helix region
MIGCVVAVLAAAPHAHGVGARDDTAWLQAQLDKGGIVSVPKLPNRKCYATRGLWVSRDGTTIASDGACIVALGAGPARLETGSGRPVKANAVFFLNHSNRYDPLPVRITISGVRIVVPAAKHMAGVDVSGAEVTLDHVSISGAPTTDVTARGGAPGSGGMTERLTVRDSSLSGGKRDILAVHGPIGLRLEGSTLSGARGSPRTRTAAGLHIIAADRGQPTLDVHVVGNTIVDNAGPGILLDLDPANGAPLVASGIEVSGNRILRNAHRAPVTRRGGIVLAGGQSDGKGLLVLTDNVVSGNRGPGILRRNLRLVVRAVGNHLRGNTGGSIKGSRATPRRLPSDVRWTPKATTATGKSRDDTTWLQARLDAWGGTVFVPKLPDGECYATHGLWVSHDDTTITSDGACITSLGPGAGRLRSIDGDSIAANAVFFVNRSRPVRAAPIHITISNLRITVPAGQSMYGVAVFGHQVTLSHLQIDGFPKDDVLIGGRANGNGYAGDVSVLDSTLAGAGRNGISAFGVIGLQIEGNTIQGVRDLPSGQPAAGIDVEPDDRAQPTLDVRILRNTIQDNAGPGVLLELDTNHGPAVLATDLEVSGNTIVRNARKRTPPKRAGLIVTGGQDGGEGTLILDDNTIQDNGGPGVLALKLKLVVQATRNDLSGNEGGPSRGMRLGSNR